MNVCTRARREAEPTALRCRPPLALPHLALGWLPWKTFEAAVRLGHPPTPRSKATGRHMPLYFSIADLTVSRLSAGTMHMQVSKVFTGPPQHAKNGLRAPGATSDIWSSIAFFAFSFIASICDTRACSARRPIKPNGDLSKKGLESSFKMA